MNKARRKQIAEAQAIVDSASLADGGGAGMIFDAKAIRQVRRTTDPRLTRVTGQEYECVGCGRLSRNGGSFGFHIRSCRKLDGHDVLPAQIAHDVAARQAALEKALAETGEQT